MPRHATYKEYRHFQKTGKWPESAQGAISAGKIVGAPAKRQEATRQRRRQEDELQRAVVEWLHLVTPRLRFPWCAVPNGGARSHIEAAILQGLGLRAGAPDLVFIAAGLELKRPGGGRLSERQREYRAECAKRGVPYGVATSTDEAERLVRSWGLLKEVE